MPLFLKGDNMRVQVNAHLTREAEAIRRAVFMEEQGFVNEFDQIDDISVHIVLFDEDIPAAVCRVYYCEERECHVIGRIAVQKTMRGKHLGAKVLRAAEEYIASQGGSKAMLSAQVRAAGFYERSGYIQTDERYDDEGCPHVWMQKSL